MIGAVAAHLDAEGGDLAEAGEADFAPSPAGGGLGWGRDAGMPERIVQPHVNPRRAADPVPRHAEVRERAHHGLLDAIDVFLHVVAGPLQVDERIGHHLAQSVEGDLAAAVGGDHGHPVRVQHVLRLARQPLGEDGRVLAEPEFVFGRSRAGGREVLHRLVRGQVIHPPQHPHLHGYSTTFTIGCEVSARYRSSSCSRLVAVTVIVTPR